VALVDHLVDAERVAVLENLGLGASSNRIGLRVLFPASLCPGVVMGGPLMGPYSKMAFALVELL